MILFWTTNRTAKRLQQTSKAAIDRLLLEVEKKSVQANSKMIELSRQQGPTSKKEELRIRSMAIQLIQDHNLFDIYRILRDICQIIHDRSMEITSSRRNSSQNEEIATMMTTLGCCASRISIYEVGELVKLLRRLYRGRFNSDGNVDERVVLKLFHSVDDLLVSDYLRAIFDQPVNRVGTSTASAMSGRRSSKNEVQSMFPQVSFTSLLSANVETGQSSLTDHASVSPLSPVLPIRIFRPNPRLEIAFDFRTKNPVYVMEHMSGFLPEKAVTRPRFYEDERIPEEFRSRLSSFVGSGYDRGHLAPAADFGVHSVRDTFNTCNISPQDHAVNISIWAKLERWCRKVAECEGRATGSMTHVVTGPLWLPSKSLTEIQHQFDFRAIGKSDALIHVPTHFFKVVVVIKECQIKKFACFLVPNDSLRNEIRVSSIRNFIIQWDQLESISGLRFFASFTGGDWKSAARDATNNILMPTNTSSRLYQSPSRNQSNTRVSPLKANVSHLRV